jgi:hypothetical protein
MRLRAPAYITKRREADPRWVRRHKRSLSGNRQWRICARMRHEERKALQKLLKQREEEQAMSASAIAKKVNDFLAGFVRKFTPRRTAQV